MYSTEYILCMAALIFFLVLGGLWILVGFLDRWRPPEDSSTNHKS